MQFPFPGKTVEESEIKFSNDWKYDKFPLVLKPKDGHAPLTQAKVKEAGAGLRCTLLDDGRIFSLDDLTSKALFHKGYTVDTQFIEEKNK